MGQNKMFFPFEAAADFEAVLIKWYLCIFLFFCYQYAGLWVAYLLRRREALTLRHSLLQKLQLKYTRSLLDRFKIPLDISIVDNTSDGLN